jgi:hypothetical protein
VVSNWDVSLHDVLERTELRPLVDAVLTSAEFGAAKPDPAIFRRGLELAGAGAAQAWHVGDSDREDVAGARATGIAPVLLRRGGGPAPEDVTAIRSLAELSELGRSLPDVWTGERQRGVQLHRLEDAVRTWGGRYGQRAWLRQLEGTVDRGHEDRLMEVIARYDGRAFPTTPGLARQWLTGRFRRREAALETIYCAELVATTFQQMGLLPKRRPASWYDPGRFWSGDRIELVPPFALHEEIAVRL